MEQKRGKSSLEDAHGNMHLYLRREWDLNQRREKRNNYATKSSIAAISNVLIRLRNTFPSGTRVFNSSTRKRGGRVGNFVRQTTPASLLVSYKHQPVSLAVNEIVSLKEVHRILRRRRRIFFLRPEENGCAHAAIPSVLP